MANISIAVEGFATGGHSYKFSIEIPDDALAPDLTATEREALIGVWVEEAVLQQAVQWGWTEEVA